MPSWLRSSWLELLLSLLVAAVEAATVAPLLQLLAQPQSLLPVPLGLALVGWSSFWVARRLLAGGWDIAAARGIGLGVWLLIVLVWFGIETGAGFATPLRLIDRLSAGESVAIVLVAAATVAWWRGASLGSDPDPFTVDLVRRVTLRGIVVVGAALVVAARASERTEQRVTDSAALALPIVLVGSLTAAAAAQVRATRRQAHSAGDRRAGIGWLGGAAGVALAILLVALVVAGIASRDVWGQVRQPLDALLPALGTALFWILVAFAYLLFLIVLPLIWLVRLVANKSTGQPSQAGSPAPPNIERFQQDAHQAVPAALRVGLEFGLTAIVFVIVVWVVMRAVRRYRILERGGSVEEERESIWSRELVLSQLKGVLAGLQAPARRNLQPPFDLATEPRDVRDAYQHLLVLAARQGTPRAPTETPVEYAMRLEVGWPELAPPVADLTSRYLLARYGEQFSEEDILQARDDWRRIATERAHGVPQNGRRRRHRGKEMR